MSDGYLNDRNEVTKILFLHDSHWTIIVYLDLLFQCRNMWHVRGYMNCEARLNNSESLQIHLLWKWIFVAESVSTGV